VILIFNFCCEIIFNMRLRFIFGLQVLAALHLLTAIRTCLAQYVFLGLKTERFILCNLVKAPLLKYVHCTYVN